MPEDPFRTTHPKYIFEEDLERWSKEGDKAAKRLEIHEQYPWPWPLSWLIRLFLRP